jgi:hypothetical protein
MVVSPSETPEAGNRKDAMGRAGGESMQGAKATQKIFPWGDKTEMPPPWYTRPIGVGIS